MIKNMRKLDRIFRFVIAVVIARLYYTNVIIGTTALILLVVFVAFCVTKFYWFLPSLNTILYTNEKDRTIDS